MGMFRVYFIFFRKNCGCDCCSFRCTPPITQYIEAMKYKALEEEIHCGGDSDNYFGDSDNYGGDSDNCGGDRVTTILEIVTTVVDIVTTVVEIVTTI